MKDDQRETVAVGEGIDELRRRPLGAVEGLTVHRSRGVHDQHQARRRPGQIEGLRRLHAHAGEEFAALLGGEGALRQRPRQLEVDVRGDDGRGLALDDLEGRRRLAVTGCRRQQRDQTQEGSRNRAKRCHELCRSQRKGFSPSYSGLPGSAAARPSARLVLSRLPVTARRQLLAALLLLAWTLLGPRPLLAAPPEAAPPEAAPPEAPLPEPSESGPQADTPELVVPELIAPLRYAYPEQLLARDEPPAGTVTVQYVVDIEGRTQEITVLEGVDPELDALAVAIVADLRYRPARYGEELVEVILSLELAFEPPAPATTDEPAQPEVEDPDPDVAGPEPQLGAMRIRGSVREAGDGRPVGGATVLAVPAGDYPPGRVRQRLYGEETQPAWMQRTLSDETGAFALAGVPDGRVRLIFLAPNFERLEWVVELKDGRELADRRYFLSRSAGAPFRTEVSVERETMPEAVVRRLTIEEVNELPGSYGDALKAVQNFPGVARQPFGAGQLAIRGAAPGDSGVYLGYHEIPTLFHFGGLTAVFNSDILAQIDFIPGNFDSRYGDALGGIVNVQPRKGRRDGIHGYIDTDLFDAGALLEGPVGKGSFVLSARRSYVDAILPAVIPDEVGLGLTLAPRYWDYQALFDYPVAGGELSLRVFGSDDRTRLLFAEANDVDTDTRNTLETIQWFHRVDAVFRAREGPWEFLVTPSYKRELFSGAVFGNFDFTVESDTFSARAELTRRLSRAARLRVGAEFVGTWFRGRAEVAPFGPGSAGATAGDTQVRETPYTRIIPSLYTTLTVRAGERLLLYPGLRLDWYAAPQNRAAVEPRLRAIWQLTPTTALKGGIGLYSQGPGALENDAVFGNERLGLQRSLHTSVSLAQELPWELSLEVTGFYKRLWDLISPSEAIERLPGAADPSPEIFANTGTGNIYGGELLLQKPLGDRFYGWLSYTLMRSVRTPAPGEAPRLFDFDQTHILTLIASYDFPLNWRLGLRMRVVSGNPLTPIGDGVFDGSSGAFLPVSGPVNSDRLPTFHQLDIRLDKTWVYRRVRVTSYLDIQNVYNAENFEFLSYGYRFRESMPVLSLPTAPSIGLRVEW